MKQKLLYALLTTIMTVSIFGVKSYATEADAENNIQKTITYTNDAMFASNNENEVIDAGYCGNSNVIWRLTKDGVLVITGSGTMPDYEQDWYSAPWYEYNSSIHTVRVSGTVKNIGAYAFCYCDDIKYAYIEKGVQTIGEGAFYECTALQEVVIEDGLTKIGAEAFCMCKNLTYIAIPNSVTSIGAHAFSTCINLSAIKLSSKITAIEEYTFSECKIETISIPSGVTKIGSYAFIGCPLKSITLPKGVTRIGDGAFSKCTSLTTFTFPGTVKAIEEKTFKECTKLKTIQIQSGVTSVRREAFYGCTALEKIVLPDTVTELYDSAFSGCKNLKEADLSDNITKIWKNAFLNCSKLTNLYLPDKLEMIDYGVFMDCDSLTVLRLPSYVKTIGIRAFASCDRLNTVRIPLSVTEIEGYAFEECKNLKSVTIMSTELKIDRDAFRNDTNIVIRCIENSSAHLYAVKTSKPYELIDLSRVEEYFDDVYTDWYTSYVQFVYGAKLMTGIKGVPKFEPNSNVTKAQVAQVLYNMECQPEVEDRSVFLKLTDVYEAEWYGDAVAWAYETGVVTGDVNEMKFYPNAYVTREQLALMLYRYASYKEFDVTAEGDLSGMKNDWRVNSWALDGVKWAVGMGLISGIDNNGVKDLAPQGNATRAQMAAILQRFCENIN